jgi:hypothetical protein
LALLQLSITAVNSDCLSGVRGNPEVRNIRLFRPGTDDKFLARVRSASITLRAPKSASALPRCGVPREATSTLGDVDENFTPATTFFKRSASAVKFCATRNEPPKSTTAISLFGPVLSSMNFADAWRARTWSAVSMVELSKKSTR